MRLTLPLFAALAGSVLLPANAGAHAVVYPVTSAPKALEKYVLRVPNERDAATTRIEIHFPRSVRVVSFADVQGWTLEVMRDSAKRVVGAAWTGSLAPERFVELPFVAVNPDSSVKLVWPVFQTYSSGERVDWNGRENAKLPASTTTIGRVARGGSGLMLALGVCIGALVLSLLALVLALRPENQTERFQPGS